MLAMLSGAILVFLGIFRIGFLANLLSHSVISGFISAQGILIAISQAPNILGVSSQGDTVTRVINGMLSQLSGC